MSNRLGGKQGTAYTGTNANQPPNWTFSDRDPNQYDINNVSLGDMWLNQTNEEIWVLVSLAGDMISKGALANWSKLESTVSPGTLDTLTGDSGGAINPDGANNINLRSGITGLSFAGNAGTNTLTLTSTGGIGDVVQKLTGNSGGAVGATLGNINIVGDGIGITIVGNPGTSTLTASLVGGGIAAESFHTDTGADAIPVAGVLNIIANTVAQHAGSSVSFSSPGAAPFNTVLFNVTDSNSNTIIGASSGNATISGTNNTVLGEGSAIDLTTGTFNTMVGSSAGTGLTTGSNNILVGTGAGASLTINDSANTLIGNDGFVGATDFVVLAAGAAGIPVFHNYPGSNASTANGGNIFIGGSAGNFTLAGAAGDAANDALGDSALNSLTTGARNDAIGAFSLTELTTGEDNVAIGHNAGSNLVSGSFNTFIGSDAGTNYTTNESNNITISALGTITESNVLRIGESTGGGVGQLNKAFIAGIRGIATGVADAIPVVIDSNGQLGTAGGGTDATTFHTDTGVDAVPVAGIINIIAGTSTQNSGSTVAFNGSGNTVKLNVTDGSDNTIIGFNSGNATLTGNSNTALGVSCGTALTSGSRNIFIGVEAGFAVTSGSGNFLCGDGSLNPILAGTSTSAGFYAFGASTGSIFLNNWGGESSGNTFLGYNSGSSFSVGQQGSNLNNTGCGQNTLATLTIGEHNAALGFLAGGLITSGSSNTLLGLAAGSNYTSNESSNICIGAQAAGTVGESNTLQIGGAGTGTGPGQINRTFIAAIRGITTGTLDAIPVVIDSSGQLGTAGGPGFIQTITGNINGPVAASAGNITIVGDGTTAFVTGSPGTNTLTISATGGGGTGPAFLAYLTTTTNTPFVSGISYTIIFDTLPYDVGASFNLGTGIFTAPVTGLYNFSCGLYSNFQSVAGTSVVRLVTSSNIFRTMPEDQIYSNNYYTNMTAGDTAAYIFSINSAITGSLTIRGTSGLSFSGINSFFSGKLVL